MLLMLMLAISATPYLANHTEPGLDMNVIFTQQEAFTVIKLALCGRVETSRLNLTTPLTKHGLGPINPA